jgi:hypothetical protein
MPANGTVRLTIPKGFEEAKYLAEIKNIIIEHKGETPVIITAAATNKKYRTKPDLWCDPCDSFINKISNLLGKENIG